MFLILWIFFFLSVARGLFFRMKFSHGVVHSLTLFYWGGRGDKFSLPVLFWCSSETFGCKRLKLSDFSD